VPTGDDRCARGRPQRAGRTSRRLSGLDLGPGPICRRTAPAEACAPQWGRSGTKALGLGALREVFPATCEQRCWFHKIANVLAALPKSAQPGAKKALAQIRNAKDGDHALRAVTAFKAAYDAKFPKATAKITDDVDELLASYHYPAEHWAHLRTTNPIESMFATVASSHHSDQGPGFPRGVGWLWASRSSKPPKHAGGRSMHHT